MKVLRHEEFDKGCEATCNGPYQGKWSKTMIGYGPEDDHFVLELSYNYGVGRYEMGNDFNSIVIHSKSAFANIKRCDWPIVKQSGEDGRLVHSPDGYPFLVMDRDAPAGDPVQKVILSASHLDRAKEYWHNKLNINVEQEDEKSVTLFYGTNQCRLVLVQINAPVNHAKAFGRIAFSCDKKELPRIEEKMKTSKEKILTPLLELDTPGKATVQVVILADPDGHEICFVGDEAFRELSKPDPRALALIEEAIEKDKSEEWFDKHGGKNSA